MADQPQPPPERSLSYRINRQVGIELVFAAGKDVVQPLDFADDGLRSVALTNFTGRLIFHRAPTVDDDSIAFSESVAPSAAPSEKDDEEEAPPSSNFLDEGANEQENKNKMALAAGAFMLKKNTSTAGPALAAAADAAEAADQAVGVEQPQQPNAAKLSFGDVVVAKLSNSQDDGEGDGSSPKAYVLPTSKKLSNKNAALLRKVLKADAAAKRNIPDSVKQHRSELRANALLPVEEPLPLHELCAQSSVTEEDLFNCLNQHPAALKQKDAWGRLPLHVLSDNEEMLQTEQGRNVATMVCSHFINEYAAAVLQPDKDGHLPFFRIVADWMEWANDQERLKQRERQEAAAAAAVSDSFATTTAGDDQALAPADSNGSSASPTSFSVTCYTGRHGGNILAAGGGGTETAGGGGGWHLRRSAKKLFFPRVEVWEEVEWCVTMLSTALDFFGRNNTLAQQKKRLKSADPRDDRTKLVEALVAKLPQLVPTVLLVEDDSTDARVRLLETVLFRRLLLCPTVPGKWVIRMLNHGGIPSQRAVDYLHLISKASIEDYTGGLGGAPHARDWRQFNALRARVFEAVEGLKGTIASLVSLDIRETDRAAATAVIWHTMSNKLSRPFVLGLVLIDLILHITLMVAFRSIVQIDTVIGEIGIDATGVIYFISAHYLLRKACEAWVLVTVSTSALHAYFTNLWIVMDTIASILTLAATIVHELKHGYATGLNALVIGLLWVKVLGFLKVVNKQMSTFILALTQILYDIRLFMIVLVVCIFMFGDMFYVTVSTKDDGQYCEAGESDSGAIEDFCQARFASYLRVYSMLLGDFELDDITETGGTTLLFIIFTIFGVVILLNVLIAVISDSYEKATMSGNMLFGRARVLYVAQNEALEEFLRPRGRSEADTSKWRRGIRWTVLVAILSTALYAQLFLIGLLIGLAAIQSWGGFVIVLIFAMVLFCALWVVSTFILDGILRDLLPDGAERVYDSVSAMNQWFVTVISDKLFGLNKEKVQTLSSDDDDEDWSGRMNYLENVIERVLAEAKVELKSEILEMRAEMHEHFEEET